MTIYRDSMESDKLVGLHSAYASTVAKQERIETPILSYLSPNLQNLKTPDGMVPFGQKAFKYKEKQYLHGRTTLNGDVAAAATTVILTDKVCRGGDIIIVNDEAITLGDTSDYLTFTNCTRGVFTGSDHAISDGDAVFVFGTSYAESSNNPTAGAIKQTSEITTSTDIFIDSVKNSGSIAAMLQYAEGNQDKAIEYTMDISIGLKHQMQTRFLWSDFTAAVGDATAGRFDGAYERIVGSNYIDFSDENPTYPDIQKMVRKCTRKGGKGPFALFVSDYCHHQIDQWAISYGKLEASELARAIFGANVFAIRVGNYLIDIISTDEMDNNLLFCSSALVGFGPKDAKRVLHPELMGKQGDYEEIMVVGEYTCQWPLPFAHCWGKNVLFGE